MTATTVLSNALIVAPEGDPRLGWVALDEGRLIEVAHSRPPAGARDLGGDLLLPGFVDLHNHGALGESLGSSEQGSREAIRWHRAHGTTTMIASVATADPELMARHVSVLDALTLEGELHGIHLEGPFLAHSHRGAHDAALLRAPDPSLLGRLLSAAPGNVRIVTFAPELAGAANIVEVLDSAGVIPAIGHTSADSATVEGAFDHGVRLVTHLFNGMPGLHHRNPGPVGAALADDRVVVELIADGHHVHPGVLNLVLRAVGEDRIALVTDSSRAAGLGDGIFEGVEVRGGEARTADGRSLAGSILTMDAAVRFVVRHAGWSITAAARSAATTPARVLGLESQTGSIRPGLAADLVVLDPHLIVRSVYRQGVQVS